MATGTLSGPEGVPASEGVGGLSYELPRCLRDDVSWMPDHASAQCVQCAVYWSSTVRRHHCRLCGGLFCYSCAPERMIAGGGGDDGAKVRCCGSCTTILDLQAQAPSPPSECLAGSQSAWSTERLAAVLRARWVSQQTLAPTAQLTSTQTRPTDTNAPR